MRLLWFCVACALASCSTAPNKDRTEAPKWKRPLQAAIRLDDVYGVSNILSANSLPVDVALNQNAVTPLMVASSLGGRLVAEWLLDHGARVDACTTLTEPFAYPEAAGCTPLLMAAASGRLEAARMLLDRGAEVTRRDSRGNTPLLMACAGGHVDVARFLIEKGARINERAPHGDTPLLRAIQMDRFDTAAYLATHGADVNAAFDNGRDALCLASEHGSLALLRVLIDKGARADPPHTTPAMFKAATGGHAEVVSFLLQRGAQTDFQNEEGWTALMKAVANGHAETVKVLCDAGADPWKRNTFGRTALDYARGLPGTAGLKTVEDIHNAVEKELFKQDELLYVLKRRDEGSGPAYQHIISTLEVHEKQLRDKRGAESTPPLER
jgi:ankyrin repeat domain-containing protein 17